MKNKKLISIISVVVALLLIVSSVTVGLFLWETDGKDSEKRVVQVNKPSGNNDPYGNDDITLDMGYTVEDMQNIDDLFGTEELCTLKVFNGSDPLCTNFRGLTSSVYHATEFLDMDPNGRKYTEEMIDLEFKRYKEAGFDYMRCQFKSDWMYTGDDSNPWDWENENMLAFYEYCKKAAEYDIEILIVFAWYYPGLYYCGSSNTSFLEVPYLMPRVFDENGDPVISLSFGTYHQQIDHEEQNRRYANWGVELVHALEDHGVTNAFNFIVFNEPREDGGSPTGAFVEYQKATFLALHEALKAEGLRDKMTLIGPNQSNKSGSLGLAAAFMSSPWHNEIFDIYSSHHTAPMQSPTDDPYEDSFKVYYDYMSKVDGYGLRNVKEFWLDEFNDDGDEFQKETWDDTWVATQQAVKMMAAFNAGVSAISAWQWVDQTWAEYYGSGGEYKYGAQVLGTMPSLYNSEIPYPNYYALSLISKYLDGENGKTYDVAFSEKYPGVYITAVELENGGWSFLVANMNSESRNININLEKGLGDVELYRYMYSPNDVKLSAAAKIITADKGFENVDKNLIDTIPGGAVVVYSTIENFG